jgi:hypothetical protein
VLNANTLNGCVYWPSKEVGGDGLKIGRLVVSFAPNPAWPAQIVNYKMDVVIITAGDDRRSPFGSTHCKPPRRTEIQIPTNKQ